ncbi:hypothetical protein OS493_003889 [Desmophyllum pertusum]|uniref:Uncharacterized protein n=1 Tax=Desmophyllum pertusum TaxID=174260 RepID=A0A9W9ZSC9_9CNID|nr:hypothetical protein OS493_003889 [Desmophyllum pertusum]
MVMVVEGSQMEKPVCKIWHSLMHSYRDEAPADDLRHPGTSPRCQIDIKVEVQSALQSPAHGGCRELATVLACGEVLRKVLDDTNSSEETVKTAEDRIKLFLLHTVLLNKLPLKYRAQAINSSLLINSVKRKMVKFIPSTRLVIMSMENKGRVEEQKTGKVK